MDATSQDIYEALKNYNCQHSVDKDGNGLPLVDIITPPGDSDISRGLQELELLAEHISEELFYRNKG